MIKIAILGSGKGSNYLAIEEAILAGSLQASIELVASDVPDALILKHAQKRGRNTLIIPTSSTSKHRLEKAAEQTLAHHLEQCGVDWVVLAGYMRIIGSPLLEKFPNRILNIHPSLLPKFKGLEAWRQTLEAGEKKGGCTVHLVDKKIDHGKILGQSQVDVLPSDTPQTLHSRIQKAEHKLYVLILEKIASGTLES